MSRHDGDGGFTNGGRQGRGGGDQDFQRILGGASSTPGRRTMTQSLGRVSSPAQVYRMIDHARALVDIVRDQLLPRLRDTIAERTMEGARSAARDVRRDLAEIDRELHDARRVTRDPEVCDEIDEVARMREALRFEVEPVLAKAPPAAPALSSTEPVLIAHGVAPLDGSAEQERGDTARWNADLDEVVAVQRLASGYPADDIALPEIAARGVSGRGGRLPHLDAIQRSFGPHDVSGVEAHVGGEAAVAARGIGAEAYATGNNVAFASAPSLFVAAHEAAHVVQQRRGVHLLGGVGKVGDPYEQNADAVAERVVRGESAVDLLGAVSIEGSRGGSVQRRADADGSLDTTVMRRTVIALANQVEAATGVVEGLGTAEAAETMAEALRSLATSLRKESKTLRRSLPLVVDPAEREEAADVAAYGENAAASGLRAAGKVQRRSDVTHAAETASGLEDSIKQLDAAGEQLDIARQATNTSAMRGWVRTLRAVAERARSSARILRATADDLGGESVKEVAGWRDVASRVDEAVGRALLRADTAEKQAEGLEAVRGSDVGKLAAGAGSDDAASLDARALAIVPDGICDDPTMQGGAACGLSSEKREQLRQEASERLGQVATAWGQAVGALDIDLAISSRAVNPLLDMLITVLLAEFGGAAVRAAQAASTAVAKTRYNRWVADDNAGFVSIDLGRSKPWDGQLPSQVKGSVNGLMAALARTARKKLAFDPSNHDKRAFMPVLASFGGVWAEESRKQVRLLPDEDLVSLDEALSGHVMDMPFFEPKVAEVLRRYEEQVLAINDNYYWGADQHVAEVTHPSGLVSYALVRRETKSRLSLGSKEDNVMPTGRYTFLRWVDRDMQAAAKAQQGEARLVKLRFDDRKWTDTSALESWVRDPDSVAGPSSWIVDDQEDNR